MKFWSEKIEIHGVSEGMKENNLENLSGDLLHLPVQDFEGDPAVKHIRRVCSTDS